MLITSAFTCTGPYAVLIMLGIKRVENRSALPVPGRGRCAVGCSKSFNAAEYGNFIQWASCHLPPEDFERIPSWAEVKDWPGKIVGACDYSVRTSDAPEAWDEGYPYWWDLSEVVCFDRPIPCRGNVGMWRMPATLAAQVTEADRLARVVGKCIATAEDAADAFRLAIPIAGEREGFFVLMLDENSRVIEGPVLVSLGTSSVTTAVQPGEVFGLALKADAKAILVAHNHPSGNLTPSVQDRELTAALKRLGDVLGIPVRDHLILGGESFQVIR